MFRKEVQLNDNFLGFDELTRLLHKNAPFNIALQKYALDNWLDETISITNKQGKTKQIPVFHYGRKKNAKPRFYLYKQVLIPFLKRHITTFEKLGVPRENLLATLGEIPTIYLNDKKNITLLSLWKVASKCTYNSKIISALCQEIKRIYLTETYTAIDAETNKEVEKPMFLFVQPRMGKCGVFMDKNALPTFLNRHKDALKNFILLLEQGNEFMSLRSFSRYLGGSKNENGLLKLIQTHLDETFVKEDKDGNQTKVPIFHYNEQKNGCIKLDIHKEGIKTFIIKYQQELINLGYFGVQALLHNFDKKGFQKGYLSIRQITQKLHKTDTFSKQLTDIIHQSYANDTISFFDKKTKSTKTRPLFFSRFASKMIYFIRESDLAFFAQKYKDILLKLGADKNVIDSVILGKEIHSKTNKMVLFRTFISLLSQNNSSGYELVKKIKDSFLSDTYIETDDKGNQTKQPIFVQANSKTGIFYYFRNMEAVKAFLKQQRDFFIHEGIRPEIIDTITGVQEKIPYSPNYLFLREISKHLHINRKGLTKDIKENLLNETYTVIENGQQIQKPFFVFMSSKKAGVGNWAISNEALMHFARKYQTQFNIKEDIILALENRITIQKKKDTHLTITQLSAFLHKSSIFSKCFAQKIATDYMDIQYQIETPHGKEKIPVFEKAYTTTGCVTTYANTLVLPQFLNEHQNELIKFGLKKESILKLIQQCEKDPLFHRPHLLREKIRNNVRLKEYYAKRQRN